MTTVQTTREQREAAMAHHVPRDMWTDAVRRWIAEDDEYQRAGALLARLQLKVESLAHTLATREAAAVERAVAAERERAESLLALGAELACRLGDITQNAISPMFAAEEAIEDWDRFIAGETIRARLTRATERGERMAGAVRALDLRAEETGYGFYHPDNPHDFHPDEESCTPQEIANHKAACDAYDAGARVDPPEVHQHVVSDDGKVVASLLITPWGIGSYALRDEKAAEVLAALAAWDARDAAGETGGAG